jgi:hypothetical protein
MTTASLADMLVYFARQPPLSDFPSTHRPAKV